MTGITGTTTMSSPDTPVGAVELEDDDQADELVRRHGAAAMTRVAAGALLAARERDRVDRFESEVFGLDRSTPAPLDAEAIAAQLGAPTPAMPAVDEAALDAFERRTFGLNR